MLKYSLVSVRFSPDRAGGRCSRTCRGFRLSPACAGGRPCRTQGRGFSFSRPTEPGGGLLRRTLGRGLLLAVSALEAVFCTFSLPRDSPRALSKPRAESCFKVTLSICGLEACVYSSEASYLILLTRTPEKKVGPEVDGWTTKWRCSGSTALCRCGQGLLSAPG